MTLYKYEQLLKEANPKLSIKRAGWGMAGIYHDGNYVCRIATREITPYDVEREEEAKDSNQATFLNPHGTYKWKRLMHRGRRHTAQHLYGVKLIKQADISKLS